MPGKPESHGDALQQILEIEDLLLLEIETPPRVSSPSSDRRL
jgi:hypothetical protein